MNFRSQAKNKIQANEPVLAINTFAGGFDVADLVSKLGMISCSLIASGRVLALSW